MTSPAGLSYGQLITTALLELSNALSAPARPISAEQAVSAAQARHRIYRTTARILYTCMTGLDRAGADRAARLSPAERRGIARLQPQLAASFAGTSHVIALVGRSAADGSIADRLTRAADAAGLAWDLLAAGLTGDGSPIDHTGAWVARMDARAVLTDAVLLARGMASVDTHLEAPLWTAALDPTASADIARPLRQVAEDCEATTVLGIRADTRDLLRLLAEPVTRQAWQRLDSTTPTAVPPPPGPLSTPAQAADAVDRYLSWLSRAGRELTVPDLSSLAATGSVLARVAMNVGDAVGGPDRTGHDTVLAWRRAYYALRPLRSIHPRPDGWRQPFRIAAWAGQQPRAPARLDLTWRQAVAHIAGRLPALADAGEDALARLQARRRLLGPLDHSDRYAYGLAGLTDTAAALDAFATARRASTVLSRRSIGVSVAPIPESTRDPTPSTPDLGAPPSRGVQIGTPFGRWQLDWQPAIGSFTADHHDQFGEDIRLGTGRWAITSLGELEEQLGLPLPSAVRGYLEAGQAVPPAAVSGRLHPADFGEPVESWPEHARPTPASLVQIPGLREQFYRRAMRAHRPLRCWEQDGYRVEILTADPYTDPVSRASRYELTYRLSHHGRVIFSGYDLGCPGAHDPASDDSLRAVVNLLTLTGDPPATAAQRAFLDGQVEDLAGLLDVPEPPYPPGIRIALTAPGSGFTTGTVVQPLTDTAGTVTGYAWRPDTADLPGHPWHNQPQRTQVSPADQVTATLAARDVGLAGWNLSHLLAYGARVEILDADGRSQPARILRAIRGESGLIYDARPDLWTSEPSERVPADRVDPIAGTAWPSLRHLTDARARDGVPLQPGEILAAGAELGYVVAGATGIHILHASPGRRAATPRHLVGVRAANRAYHSLHARPGVRTVNRV